MPVPVFPNLRNAVESGASDSIILARQTGPLVRPTIRVPRAQQGFPPPNQNTVDTTPYENLERGSDVAADPNGNALDATRIVVDRKRKRRKNCCKPFVFQNDWLVKGNSIYNKFDKRIDFTKNDFAILSKGTVFTQRGFAYQYFITKEYDEYKASGGGTYQWADGEESARCWLIEAKYHASPRSWMRQHGIDPDKFEQEMNNPLRALPKGGLPAAPKGPELRAAPKPPAPPGTDEQFERYGKVINSPDAPALECWNIGLHVIVSLKGLVLFEYMYRMLRYNIPGLIEYRPAPNGD